MTNEHFLSLVEAHIKKRGISAKKFGTDAMNDPCFVSDLRGGRSPSLTVLNRVLDYMAANKNTKAA